MKTYDICLHKQMLCLHFIFTVFLQVLEIFLGNFLKKNCSRTHNDQKENIKSSKIQFGQTLSEEKY
jgi:hypothetical protein